MSPDLCNITAEQSLIGAILDDNSAMMHVSNLSSSHFYEPVHQRIFSEILKCWSAGQYFSPVLMKPMFDDDPALEDIGGGSYLWKLASMAVTVTNIEAHARVIIDYAHRREISAALEEGQKLIYDMDSPPAEQALSMSETLSAVVTDMGVSMFQDDYEVTQDILQDIVTSRSPYKTGYAKLDTVMGGGVCPGKSYGFAARKKIGKTILAGSISHNFNKNGVKHAFICGEMSPKEVQKRTTARVLQVNPSYLERDFPEGEITERDREMMRRVAGVADSSKRAVIYKNAPGITFDDFKRFVLLARMQKKITGFILDYWQLVGGKPKGKSTAEHLDEVAQWIADTCRKYDLWSITMAQINQEGNTRGGEGIRLAFDQVYILQAPNDDAGRSERWLEMSDTRYTSWRSVGSENHPGFYLNEFGPYFSETFEDNHDLMI